jgi:hypothetical protein
MTLYNLSQFKVDKDVVLYYLFRISKYLWKEVKI